jgi:hypothetical protein
MKKQILISTAFLLSIFYICTQKTYATHIPGANITYTCNPANPLTYTFTFTIFRKCPGTHPATMSASNFTLTNSCGLTNPTVPTFNQVGVAQDVNQLCSSATSNCSGGTEPGVWLYTYEATITFPADCDSWNLAFELCCRDGSSNLSGGTSNDMAVSTLMNTATAPCNNSPVVTSAPIPYACTNTNFNYCLTIADPEGDSTYFSMVAPAGNAQTPIAHLAGFSPTAPLNNFTLDPLTGCISFNHPNTGNYVVAIQINSYDAAGNLITSIIHDFQIMVISCTNTPPSNPVGGISNFSGTGTQLGPNTVAACYGDVVCFDVVFSDPVDPGNNLTITQDGTTLLPGATFTQTGNNPVTGTFCWTSQPGYTGNVVTFIAEDDGCPVMGTTGFAVNFNITTGVYAGADVTICGAQSGQLNAFGAGSYTWTPATGLSCTNCASPTATPAVTTTYTVTGNLTGACSNTDQVTVNVVPDFSLSVTPANATICANEIIQLTANGQAGFGPFVYSWAPSSTLNNDTIANPLANPLTSTSYTATVTAANGCTKQVTSNITISGIGPTVTVTPSDTDICAGESVPLSTTAFVYPLTCGISAGCSGTAYNVDVGTNTSGSSTYSPFYGSTSTTTNYTKKVQYIYTAAELNALGYYGGTIRTLSLYFTTTNSYRYDNVKIWMGCTSQDQYPNTSFIPTTSLTQVYGTVNNLNPTDNNWHTFNITDWDWDGASNLVVQFCAKEDNVGNVGSNSVRYTSTSPAYRCVYDYSSTVVSCNEATGSRTTNRANIRFNMCVQSVSSPSYSWTPTAGLNNPNIANPTATPGTSTSYVLDVTSAGCTGSVIANVNVSPNYTLNPNATNMSICYGASTTLSGNPSGVGPYNYSWTPGGAFSSPNASNPTVTPTGPTTYYVSTSNGYCTKTDSITINVAGLPVTATASQDTVCPGTMVNLNTISASPTCGINYSNCTGTSSTAVSATGTSASSTYGPFYGSTSTTLIYTNKKQYIFTAAELTTMGFSAGMITELALDVSTSTGRSYDDMEIWMGCTSQGEYAVSNFISTSSLSQVYSNSKYTTQNGWNTFNITGFDWDGSSNIVIQFCSNNADQTGSESVRYTSTSPVYKALYYNSSSVNACNNATGSRTYSRPNMRFQICNNSFGVGSTYSWSPTSVSNPTIQNPTASVGSNTTYTVTVTDPANPGCPTTGNISVYIDNTNSVTASNDTIICPGDPASLNSSFNGPIPPIAPPCGVSPGCTGASSSVQIGTGTSMVSTYSPFYGSTSTTSNYTKKIQYIYTAAELNALGYVGGTIRDLSLDFPNTNAYMYDNVRIWIGCTSLPEFPNTTFVTTASLTQVYGPVNNFNPIDNSWNTFNITDWDWDGTSNLIIQFCASEDNSNNDGYNQVRYTSTSPFYRCLYDYSSTVVSCNEITGSRVTSRANIRFTICDPPPGSVSYSWTPSATLSNPNISNPTATPGVNTTYVVAVAGGACTVYDTVDISMCAVLPIELLSFDGHNNGTANELYWSTATEINNDYFTLERSTDGVSFIEITKVDGAGNSNMVNEYNYMDIDPFVGINYYRLKQTDFNGVFAYSTIIALEVKKDNILSVYPNPSSDVITISYLESSLLNSVIKIYDAQGKIVIDKIITEESIGYKIDVKSLNNGIYFIKINNGINSWKGSFFKH